MRLRGLSSRAASLARSSPGARAAVSSLEDHLAFGEVDDERDCESDDDEHGGGEAEQPARLHLAPLAHVCAQLPRPRGLGARHVDAAGVVRARVQGILQETDEFRSV